MFNQNLYKDIQGQVELSIVADMFGMAKRLLEGEALSMFELEIDVRKNVKMDSEKGPVG